MDDIEEWSGCSYIQLKEMSQDRQQWRRKTIEWVSDTYLRQMLHTDRATELTVHVYLDKNN